MHELTIALTPTLLEPVKKALCLFLSREKNWIENPSLQDTSLKMRAMAFPFFLAYIDPSAMNELDVFRLRNSAMGQLRASLNRPGDFRQKRYYEQVLSNLKDFQVGEFIL